MTRRARLIRNSLGADDVRDHVRAVERLIELATATGGLHLGRRRWF